MSPLTFVAGANPSASRAPDERIVHLDFSVFSFHTSVDRETGLPFASAIEYRAELGGVPCETARWIFDDQHMVMGFGVRPCSEPLSTVGRISYVENSTGSDGGVCIEINADSFLPVLLEVGSPEPEGSFDPDRAPLADVRIWFSLFRETVLERSISW
jgi:hypothetical protein